MGWTMKRQTSILAIAAAVMFAAGSSEPVSAGTFEPSYHYTWGISNDQVDIAEGSVITEAVLTIHNLTNWDGDGSDSFYLHLLNDPLTGWQGETDTQQSNDFSDSGAALRGVRRGSDLVCTFSAVDDAMSWVWNIYEKPLDLQLADSAVVSLSSALLELIDFAGAGLSFGLGFDADTAQNCTFDGISLDLTVRPYEQGGEAKTLSSSLIVEDFEQDDLSNWEIVDDGTMSSPSMWRIVNGVLAQNSLIYSAPTDRTALKKPGTFVKYKNCTDWTDYSVSCQMWSASVNETGIMFRVQDDDNYYRFSWRNLDRYSRLVRVQNGQAVLLDEVAGSAYDVGRVYDVRISARGETLQVFVDGVLRLAAEDATFSAGTVGLYSWANNGSYFDDLAIERYLYERQGTDGNGALLATDFSDGSMSGWQVVDQGAIGTSSWSAVSGVLSQKGGIYSNPLTNQALEKRGTFAKYVAGASWTDYEASCIMRTKNTQEQGIMFRVQDNENYYRFSWRIFGKYSRLVKVVDGKATLLGESGWIPTANQICTISVLAAGDTLAAYVDGVKLIEATDSTFASGTIALYCWRNTDANFDDVIVRAVTETGPDAHVENLLTSSDFADGEMADWQVFNKTGARGVSAWSATTGVLGQKGSIYSNPATTAALEKEGTFAQYLGGAGWTNYEASFTVRSTSGYDLGLMFRVQDYNNSYYRFSWSGTGRYARLVKMVDGTATLLQGVRSARTAGRTYAVRVVAQGSTLQVYIDGVKVLEATDETFSSGTMGFYCWRNNGAYFDNVVVKGL